MSQPEIRSVEEIFEEAARLRKAKATEQALALFQQLLADRYHDLDRKHRKHAWLQAMACASRMRDWKATHKLARAAVQKFPQLAKAHHYMGEALWQRGRREEAAAALNQALALDPDLSDARALLKVVGEARKPARSSQPLRAWPSRLKAFESPRRAIASYLLKGRPEDRFIRPDSVFTTMGSCFAENLAIRLEQAGYRTNFEPIGEEVNSTYANRYLMDWIEHGPRDEPTRLMQDIYGAAIRDRYLKAFAATDIFVMSLGVAPAFFNRTTGAFAFSAYRSASSREHLQRENAMRTTSVTENVDNIRHILAAVRRLCRHSPRVVLTVSPVPLGGTTEMESAVTADCLSKSTLRLACQEILEEQQELGVTYWPSYEMVRWFGPHYGPGKPLVYGADDGDTRHVSQWLVETIIDLFLEHHSAALSAAAAAE